MKTSFVRVYLLVTAMVLGATALAKIPSIFHEKNWCLDPAILGVYQPEHWSNERVLGWAASVEGFIVLLIVCSPWRWLPCLGACLWGLACAGARIFLMDPYVHCQCLGWLAKPGLSTNIIATGIALALAGGGWVAFRMAWEKETRRRAGPA